MTATPLSLIGSALESRVVEGASWPVHDPVTAVIYAASSQQVTDTFVAGRRLLADGRLRHADESAILERAEQWRLRLDATAGEEAAADE